MIICGLKLTHDASVALIDNGKLIFCHELEKINNNRRYSEFNEPFSFVESTLDKYGYNLKSIDSLVVDGWHNNYEINDFKNKINFKLAPYGWLSKKQEDVFECREEYLSEWGLKYKSYKHISGHIFAAYCTSPFAVKNENSFILVWDGAIFPRLFYYRPKENKLDDLGVLFPLIGTFYSYFANLFPPFNNIKLWEIDDTQQRAFGDLSIAGKVMAFIGLGKVNSNLLADLHHLFKNVISEISWEHSTDINYYPFSHLVFSEYHHLSPADILATVHVFVNDLLIQSLALKVLEYPNLNNNLCYAGGCALNIKWNSSIRSSGIFKEIWVPPFPNDSGSAIGTACTEMINIHGVKKLQWSVYSGPSLIEEYSEPHWKSDSCDIICLAKLLAEGDEPVVFLNGEAELGPRALGNRSILASPSQLAMKDLLNLVKKRENYRPVAPLCLEEDAELLFDPGFPDPYMLFDHKVRRRWVNKIPAVLHVDSTARLQTINCIQNPVIYKLLTEFKVLTGLPLLCNTSANFNGKGFFPDVKSAMIWGEVNFIWSNGTLFYKNKEQIIKKVSEIIQVKSETIPN